jgi:hypothetical protein
LKKKEIKTEVLDYRSSESFVDSDLCIRLFFYTLFSFRLRNKFIHISAYAIVVANHSKLYNRYHSLHSQMSTSAPSLPPLNRAPTTLLVTRVGPTIHHGYTWSRVGLGRVEFGSGRVEFGSGHVGLSDRKSWPAPDPSHVWVGSDRVWSGFGFLVKIFGLSQVGSGYFFSLGENFGPRSTRRTVGSGFFGWVESSLSGRAAMIRYNRDTLLRQPLNRAPATHRCP